MGIITRMVTETDRPDWERIFLAHATFGKERQAPEMRVCLGLDHGSCCTGICLVAKAHGWDVVRWMTRDDNHPAWAVHDRHAEKTEWVIYQL